MVFPLVFSPGIVFDLRHVFLVLAGPFGGWPAALLTALTTSGLRVAQGGVGLYADLAGIAISSALGLAFAFVNKRPDFSLAKIAWLGLAASTSLASLFLLPISLALDILGNITAPFVIINFIGVMISAESLNRFRVQVHREQALVRDMATDPLTGLSNRRAFDTQGPQLAATQIENQGRYAIMVVDIDRFKSINDTFGHANGDKVLRAVAGIIAGCATDNDLVVRYGGEEIALVLPGCDNNFTAVIANRIRGGIEDTIFDVGGIKLKVTVSIGYTVVDKPGIGFWAAFEDADTALYRAKSGGRNRVEFAKAA